MKSLENERGEREREQNTIRSLPPDVCEMQVHFTKYILKEASVAVKFPYPIPPLRA